MTETTTASVGARRKGRTEVGPDLNPLDLPVADRPLARQLAEWRIFLVGGGRVLALQGSHPTVAKGLYDHSTLLSKPLERVRLTTDYAMRMMFGSDVTGTGAEIRELHRDVKGTGLDDRPYHAWNREAWTWVHLSTFDAMLYGLRAMHPEIPIEQQQAAYDWFRAAGVTIGVRDQDMPATIDGLQAYVREMVETSLTHAPDFSLSEKQPQPFGQRIPAPLLRRVGGLVTSPLLIAGAFPSTLRKRWGIRWTLVHEAAYQAQLVAFRAATGALPDRLRMFPEAHRALHPAAAVTRRPTTMSMLEIPTVPFESPGRRSWIRCCGATWTPGTPGLRTAPHPAGPAGGDRRLRPTVGADPARGRLRGGAK